MRLRPGRVLLLLALLVLLLAGALAWLHQRPVLAVATEVDVPRGATPRSVGAALVKQGVPVQPWLIEAVLRLRGPSARLRAGVFGLPAGASHARIVQELLEGELLRKRFTVVEGWTVAQLRAAIAAEPELRHETTDWTPQRLLEALGETVPHPEGLFAPDTYLVDRRSTDLELLRRAHALQKQVLARAWSARQPGLPLRDAREALVLASIVEKETGRAEDRSMVASVFVNRLRLGMRLQSDPTTIYGLGDAFTGDLTRADLRRDTPWNTYTRAGLPPTPIALPGRAAIEATLAPAASRALYFVARGDGSSEFTETLEAHNRAVDRFQRRRAGSTP